jgi:phosphopantothenoylcysteine synthetase/decarboxylase
MQDQPTLFIFGTAAGICRQIGVLISGSIAEGWQTYTVATPNVARIVAPDHLFAQPGNHWISDYEQPPLDVFPFGTMLVAPCTFNTFNKLAHGIADNLATSMLADALGAGCPIFIAPSMNPGLWNHPQTHESYQRLTSWGCTIIDPQISDTQVIMAPIADMLSRLREHFARH